MKRSQGWTKPLAILLAVIVSLGQVVPTAFAQEYVRPAPTDINPAPDALADGAAERLVQASLSRERQDRTRRNAQEQRAAIQTLNDGQGWTIDWTAAFNRFGITLPAEGRFSEELLRALRTALEGRLAARVGEEGILRDASARDAGSRGVTIQASYRSPDPDHFIVAELIDREVRGAIQDALNVISPERAAPAPASDTQPSLGRPRVERTITIDPVVAPAPAPMAGASDAQEPAAVPPAAAPLGTPPAPPPN